MSEAARRWRLALGPAAEDQLGPLTGRDGARDEALDYLYRREYEARLRAGAGADPGQGLGQGFGPGFGPGFGQSGRSGGLDPTRLTALTWLGRARGLFPREVFETLQSDALNRYGLTELLSDPGVLAAIEPRQDLLPALLAFHSRAPEALKAEIRRIARQVIDDITARLKPRVEQAFSGQRNRFRRSNLAASANFDWRATLRENLTRYDPERQRIVAERLRFNARTRRHLPWTVLLCVDQSGSMTDSVIHSAVLAAILTGLPGVRVKMVLFDTAVLDVTDQLSDPLDTLLSVQLGGGTDIGQALGYCETLVEDPGRTVLALVSDFFEGGSGRRMLAAIARLAEAQVTLLGLPALDNSGRVWVNETLAAQAAALGMEVGAMSPECFADWLADVMAGR